MVSPGLHVPPERVFPSAALCPQFTGKLGVRVMPLDTKAKFSLPKLPYAENALEPVISAKTISVPLRQASQGLRRQAQRADRRHAVRDR